MKFGGFVPCTLIDYPGKTACIVYTIGCNFRCPYCHNPELVNETVERTFSESRIFTFLESRRGVIDGVVITGGEPTMHGQDLLLFMRRVKERGFLVKLDTNGTNPKLLETAINQSLVDYVAMDVKAPLSTYHRVVGRPVDIGAIRRSIDTLLSSGVPYEFRTTVVKPLLSPEDLEGIAREIAGASRYYLQKFVSSTILNPQFKRKVEYTDVELEAFRSNAEKYVAFCG